MKNVITALCFTICLTQFSMTASAQDQTPITSANYFEYCMQTPFMSQSFDTQKESCACMAAKMKAWEEGVAAEEAARPKGLVVKKKNVLDKNVLYSQIYAPCINIPAYEIVYQKCYYDDRNHMISETIQHLDSLCRCQSEVSALFLKEYGEPLMAALLVQFPHVKDPLELILNSSEYTTSMSTPHTECYNQHASMREIQ